MLRSAQPQQALACFTLTALRERFVFGDFVTVVKDLIHQPQHLARISADRQHILADVPQVGSPADLSKVGGQRCERGVIEFRRVMQKQNRFGVVSNPAEACAAGRRQ